MNKNKWYPLGIALVLALVCSILSMGSLLYTSGFPITADGLGHMTKVKYIAEQLSIGHIPSWFPAWYCGSATTQYYVPLSYYIMAPIYMLVKNIDWTFRVYCVAMYFVGAMGVWYFCHKKIGGASGYIGIVAFCFQGFFADSLYLAGVVAQGPIFALMPWYLYFVVSCIEKMTARRFVGATLTLFAIILSHAMHGFMVCVCTMGVFFILLFAKRVHLKELLMLCLSILFSGGLLAFWAVVGATGLENPGVPYLLPEAGDNYAADFSWFTMHNTNTNLNISIVISMGAFLAILIVLIRGLFRFTKGKEVKTCLGIVTCVGITIFTVIFSFGYHLPFWGLIPMSKSLVPGRILSYSSVTMAILLGWLGWLVVSKVKWRFVRISWYVVAIIFLCLLLRPWQRTYNMWEKSNSFDTVKSQLDTETSAFDKGRYSWNGPINCGETYFPVQWNYNLADGWNIEGSLHNQTIWNFSNANASGCTSYIAKQMAFWNVRTMAISSQFGDLIQTMKNVSAFREKPEGYRKDAGMGLYTSNQPSNYFMIDQRNALVIDEKSGKLAVQFPNLIKSKSNNLLDYSKEECKKYKFIYIFRPEIKSEVRKKQYEDRIRELTDEGVQVAIEPNADERFHLFGVSNISERVEGKLQCVTQPAPFEVSELEKLDLSGVHSVESLYNLDSEYVSFTQKSGKVKNGVMGSKNVGSGKVFFIGGQLTQNLSAIFVNALGKDKFEVQSQLNSQHVENTWKNMFRSYQVEPNYLPIGYSGVTYQQFTYNGGNFDYESKETKDVVISITYSPRWKITVDGQEIQKDVDENLIRVTLPKGSHHVIMRYGITSYGILGYAISFLTLVVFVIFVIRFSFFQELVAKGIEKSKNKLQI